MGFGYFMYSHSLVPVIDPQGSGRDKVGIRAMVSLLILNCRFVFSYTTAVLGCQMLVLSSLLLVFCVASVLCCVLISFGLFFSVRKVEHEMLMLLKQLIMLSSPFRAKLLPLLLDIEEEEAVVEECCLMLYFFWA